MPIKPNLVTNYFLIVRFCRLLNVNGCDKEVPTENRKRISFWRCNSLHYDNMENQSARNDLVNYFKEAVTKGMTATAIATLEDIRHSLCRH